MKINSPGGCLCCGGCLIKSFNMWPDFAPFMEPRCYIKVRTKVTTTVGSGIPSITDVTNESTSDELTIGRWYRLFPIEETITEGVTTNVKKETWEERRLAMRFDVSDQLGFGRDGSDGKSYALSGKIKHMGASYFFPDGYSLATGSSFYGVCSDIVWDVDLPDDSDSYDALLATLATHSSYFGNVISVVSLPDAPKLSGLVLLDLVTGPSIGFKVIEPKMSILESNAYWRDSQLVPGTGDSGINSIYDWHTDWDKIDPDHYRTVKANYRNHNFKISIDPYAESDTKISGSNFELTVKWVDDFDVFPTTLPDFSYYNLYPPGWVTDFQCFTVTLKVERGLESEEYEWNGLLNLLGVNPIIDMHRITLESYDDTISIAFGNEGRMRKTGFEPSIYENGPGDPVTWSDPPSYYHMWEPGRNHMYLESVSTNHPYPELDEQSKIEVEGIVRNISISNLMRFEEVGSERIPYDEALIDTMRPSDCPEPWEGPSLANTEEYMALELDADYGGWMQSSTMEVFANGAFSPMNEPVNEFDSVFIGKVEYYGLSSRKLQNTIEETVANPNHRIAAYSLVTELEDDKVYLVIKGSIYLSGQIFSVATSTIDGNANVVYSSDVVDGVEYVFDPVSIPSYRTSIFTSGSGSHVTFEGKHGNQVDWSVTPYLDVTWKKEVTKLDSLSDFTEIEFTHSDIVELSTVLFDDYVADPGGGVRSTWFRKELPLDTEFPGLQYLTSVDVDASAFDPGSGIYTVKITPHITTYDPFNMWTIKLKPSA